MAAAGNNGNYQPSLKRRYFDASRNQGPVQPPMNHPGMNAMGFGGPPNKRPPLPMPGVPPLMPRMMGPWDRIPPPSAAGPRPPLPFIPSAGPGAVRDSEPTGSHGQSAASLDAQTNLIVNYLPQTLRDSELLEMFSPYGEIANARIVRDKNTGYSFGYGFVKYTDPSAASTAISILNGLQVLNKVIKVSYARPPSVEIKDTNLYITNLPRTTTDLDLVQMFAPFGQIVQKHILFDKYTQLPRGVAFVRYDRREQANAAIEQMNGFMPPGAEEPISVRLAENHGKQKASYASGFQAGMQRRFN